MLLIPLAPWLIAPLLIFSLASTPSSGDTQSIESRHQQLKQLLAEEWEYEMRESPEFATIIGDYRYNDRWTDASLGHIPEQKRDLERWLARFAALDTTGFPEQEKLSQSLMVRNLKERLEALDLKTYEMLVDQFNGVHLLLPQMVALVPLDSTKHYEDYLARLRLVPHLLDEIVDILKQGKKDKLMPPKFLLEKTVDQCKSIADPAGEANAFAEPIKKFPDTVPEADRKRLRDSILAAIDSDVRPAYNKLAKFIATDYAPYG